MSSAPTRRTLPTVVRKAAVDESALSVSAVLTFPDVDLAGDFVVPSGLDFTSHRRDPWVDLEHSGERVGWARKSLSRPGDYGVSWSWLDIDGTRHRLPVGTTHFDPNDRLSMQVFRMVAEDALPGVSLEFRPVPGFMKSLGRSPLEPRDAYRFERADVVRWTHCATPVNSGALTVTKSSRQVPSPLVKILRDNRIGSEELHPVIRKALAPYVPTRTAVRVEKSMDEQTPQTAYDAAVPEVAQPADQAPESDEGDDDATSPTAQALYDAAQEIVEVCERLKQSTASSEHKAGKKKAESFCDAIESLAEKILGAADMVHEDVVGGSESGDMDDADPEPEVESDSTETDDDGVMKAMNAPHRRAYRETVLKSVKARRYTEAEVRKGLEQPKEDPKLDRLRRERDRELRRFEKFNVRAGN